MYVGVVDVVLPLEPGRGAADDTGEFPLITCFWAAKGGAGSTVVAAVHALTTGRTSPTVIVDLDGDLPAVLGLDEPGSGLTDWLLAGDRAPVDALDRLLVPVTDRLHLLPRGAGSLDHGSFALLHRLLECMPRHVVVDAGTRPTGVRAELLRAAVRSVLVTRACYLALRRAARETNPITDVVLIREPQRALRSGDVATALGVPVRVQIPHDPGLARAVDAGLLTGHIPGRIERAMAKVGR